MQVKPSTHNYTMTIQGVAELQNKHLPVTIDLPRAAAITPSALLQSCSWCISLMSVLHKHPMICDWHLIATVTAIVFMSGALISYGAVEHGGFVSLPA
jgi:hypothetical protein